LLRTIAAESKSPVRDDGARAVQPRAPPRPSGNNCALQLAFAVGRFERVEWASRVHLLAWTTAHVTDRPPMVCVDAATRTVTRVLPNACGMAITDVAISNPPKYVAVVVNGFIVTFFAAAAMGRPLAQITLTGTIYVQFVRSAEAAVLVSSSGVVSTTSQLGRRGVRVRRIGTIELRRGDAVSGIAYAADALYVATGAGLVRFNLETARAEEVRAVRHPITDINVAYGQTVAIHDDKGRIQLLTSAGEVSALPGTFKRAVMCSPVAFVVRGKRDAYIAAVQVVGSVKTSFPACAGRHPLLRPPHRWEPELRAHAADPDVCARFGLPFVGRLLRRIAIPGALRSQLAILPRIIGVEPELLLHAFRTALLVGAYDAAYGFITSTAMRSPGFLVNILKSAVFGPHATGEIVIFAAEQLIRAGHQEDGFDLLMIVDAWAMAAEIMGKAGMIDSAGLVCRLRERSDEQQKLVAKIAQGMFMRGALSSALMLLADCGMQERIGALLLEVDEFAQAALLLDP
jgi:hypothetical protein